MTPVRWWWQGVALLHGFHVFLVTTCFYHNILLSVVTRYQNSGKSLERSYLMPCPQATIFPTSYPFAFTLTPFLLSIFCKCKANFKRFTPTPPQVMWNLKSQHHHAYKAAPTRLQTSRRLPSKWPSPAVEEAAVPRFHSCICHCHCSSSLCLPLPLSTVTSLLTVTMCCPPPVVVACCCHPPPPIPDHCAVGCLLSPPACVARRTFHRQLLPSSSLMLLPPRVLALPLPS